VAASVESLGAWSASRNRVPAWAAVVACILSVPLIAMKFTDEANWSLFDFILMGALLFGVGLTCELVASKGGTVVCRAAVGVACATGGILVWINAAVGIIGDGPVNLMYFGMLAVGALGALMSRFRPRGTSVALIATAVAQMLVPVVALVLWKVGPPDLLTDPDSPHGPFHPGIVQLFCLNGVFAMLFAGSAALFREAAISQAELE